MSDMGTPKKLGDWESWTIELPPGWGQAVRELADQLNRGKRGLTKFVWAVAVDLVLSQRPEEVLRRAAELEQLRRVDFPALIARRAAGPEAAASRLAETFDESAPTHPRRKRRGSA